MTWVEEVLMLGNVCLAGLLGGVLGIERELADKPAGLRTHILVAATSALLIGLSDALVNRFGAVSGANLSSDPIRIVQAIVVGIGFIGAGTIIRRSEGSDRIEGLTTGASLLLAASIGVCVAAEQIILAVGVTILALVVLLVFGALEEWNRKKRASRRSGAGSDRA